MRAWGAGTATSTSPASCSGVKATAPPAKASRSAARSPGSVVSSRATPTEPSAYGRRLIPFARARSTIARPFSGDVRTRSVSKNGAVPASRPSRRRPSCRTRARACTRRAIARRPSGPVVDRVHRGHDREQHLRGADVARGLVAADVLLAGLERQAVGRPALGVLRDADEPPGQVPLVLVLRGEEGGVRPAVAHRHAEALGRAERHVRPELPRRAQEGQGEEVGRHHEQRARGVGALGEAREVADDAVRGRVLHEDAEELLAGEVDRPRPGPRGRGSRGAPPSCARPRSSAGGSPRPRRSRPGPASPPPGRASSPRPRPSPRRGGTRWRGAGR